MALIPETIPYFEGGNDSGELRNYLNIIIRALNLLIEYVIIPTEAGGIFPVIPGESPYTARNQDLILECDCTSGDIIIVVPVGRVPGRDLTIVKTDTTTNGVFMVGDDASDLGVMAQPAAGLLMQSKVVYSNGSALRAI